MEIEEIASTPKAPIWPPLKTAVFVSDWANVALILSLAVGFVATALIVWMAGVKEAHWDASREEAERRMGELAKQAEASHIAIAEASARAAAAHAALESVRKAQREKTLPAETKPPFWRRIMPRN